MATGDAAGGMTTSVGHGPEAMRRRAGAAAGTAEPGQDGRPVTGSEGDELGPTLVVRPRRPHLPERGPARPAQRPRAAAGPRPSAVAGAGSGR